MGILSTLKKIEKVVLTGLAPIYAPLQTAVGLATKKFTPEQAVKGTLVSSAVVGASIANPSLVPTIAKTVISYPKTAIATAVISPVVAGYVSKDPIGALKTSGKVSEKVVSEGVPALYNIGGNVQELVKDPSLEKAKDIFYENPIATSVIAGLGALGIASAGLGGLGVTASNISLENAINNAKNTLPKDSGANEVTVPKDKTLQTDDSAPINTQTETITAGTSARRKSSSKRAVIQPSIRIKIDNRDNYQSGKIFKPRRSKK